MKRVLVASVLAGLLLHVEPAAAKIRYVDPRRGDDASDGSEHQPWRTITHAMGWLAPGDTLLLRGGRYREQVRCSLVGTATQPIVIRGTTTPGSTPGSTPGPAPGSTPRPAPGIAATRTAANAAQGDEPVIIDAGLAEFFDTPAAAWEPIGHDLYQSTKSYRNVTGMLGAFADKRIPLVTYYLYSDLVSTNERAGFDPDTRIMDRDVYVGPGIWLDRQSGRLLSRLGATHHVNAADAGALVQNYTGPDDPRTVPLVIAAEGATPLTLDGARHVRIENVTLAGAAPDAVVLRDCAHVALDRLVVHCGQFRGQTSGPVRVTNSQFFGTIPPWLYRSDASTGCASGQIRDVARVAAKIVFDTSHEVMLQGMPRVLANDHLQDRPLGRQRVDAGAGDMASPQMTRNPMNHDWEVAHCEFHNGHDGVFLVGRSMRMHHCVIDNMQDDAVDFSTPVAGLCDEVVFEENLIRRCVTAISTHNQGAPAGRIHITGNVVDLRSPMAWSRPTDEQPEGRSHPGNCFFMHGADAAKGIESYFVYHNTIVGRLFHRSFYAHGFLSHTKPGSTRRVFNNLFIYLSRYEPPYLSKSLDGMDLHTDNNLHWSVVSLQDLPPRYLETWRQNAYSDARAESNGGRWEAASFVADPILEALDSAPGATNDYRPKAGSPAIGAARELAGDWPGRRSRTVGALDPGAQPLRVGVDGRITAGEPWMWLH